MKIVRVERYGKVRDYVQLDCAKCGKEFVKRKSFIRPDQLYQCCSRKCFYDLKKDNDGSHKTCSHCLEKKPVRSFYKRKASYDGLTSKCKDCLCVYARERRENAPPEETRKKHLDFAYRLRTTYGITVEDYARMEEEQDGRCKICRLFETRQFNGIPTRLAVDHCHATGKVRGLLCSECNNGLGRFKDSEKLLLRAIDYLKE